MIISRPSATDLYHEIMIDLLSHGVEVSPRGKGTLELRGVTLELTDPNQNIIASKIRGLNHGFAHAEWLWIMTGCALKEAVKPFNRGLKIAEDSEGSHTLAGAYGPKWIEQLPFVLDTLRNDPDSRQAVVNIWRDRPRASADTPCTLSWQFFIRDGALEMQTHMRSNDAVLGTPYDIYTFTQIQRWLASELQCPLGFYTHFVGSLHIYEPHVDMARAMSLDDLKLPAAQDFMYTKPGLPLLQELLLSAARFKDRLNQELDTGIDVERWRHEWQELLSPYGPQWWTLPPLLLSGHKECRQRFVLDDRFAGTPWADVFREEKDG